MWAFNLKYIDKANTQKRLDIKQYNGTSLLHLPLSLLNVTRQSFNMVVKIMSLFGNIFHLKDDCHEMYIYNGIQVDIPRAT